MNESQREKAFPIHVELGKKSDMNSPVAPPMDKSDRKYYPTVYISDVRGLEKLPEKGCILVDYRRRSLTINQRDGESTCSVELELRTICMPEEYDDNDDMSDIVDDLMSKASKKEDEDEDEE